jgi:hypothetical protein
MFQCNNINAYNQHQFMVNGFVESQKLLLFLREDGYD